MNMSESLTPLYYISRYEKDSVGGPEKEPQQAEGEETREEEETGTLES